MTSLLDIEKRLVAAEGADRELEGDIFFLLDPDFPSGTALHMSAAPDPATFATGAYTSVKAPAYLSSVDAALAFAERVLPEFDWTRHDDGDGVQISVWWESQSGGMDFAQACAPTNSLAICLAVVRALIAQKGRG